MANSFFGRSAGWLNTGGGSNSFFGAFASDSNLTGGNNAFFRTSSGSANIDGSNNAFIGVLAGTNTTNGDRNTFVGTLAGVDNTTGRCNTYIGFNAKGAAGITNSVAIGANAIAGQSDGIYLGTPSQRVVIPGSLFLSGQALAGQRSVFDFLDLPLR